MARVTGNGGIFFKARDPDGLGPESGGQPTRAVREPPASRFPD
jgi:hypothetical protein